MDKACTKENESRVEDVWFGEYRMVEMVSNGVKNQVIRCEKSSESFILKVAILRKDRDRHTAERVSLSLIERTANPDPIVQIIETFDTETHSVIVFPDLGNQVLYDIPVTEKAMSRSEYARRMVDLMIQVCRAVSVVHASGVAHRDLKPENVMVIGSLDSPDMRIVLIDFDLALDLEGRTSHVRWNRGSCGTVGFIAPEIIMSSPIIDYRASDVYALGVMLFGIFNNNMMPYNLSISSDIKRIMERERPKVSSYRHCHAINNLIAEMIRKDRTRRPSLPEVIDRLERIRDYFAGIESFSNPDKVDNCASTGTKEEEAPQN